MLRAFFSGVPGLLLFHPHPSQCNVTCLSNRLLIRFRIIRASSSHAPSTYPQVVGQCSSDYFFDFSDLGDDPFEDDLLGVGVTNLELVEFLSDLNSAPSRRALLGTFGNSGSCVRLILRLTLSLG